MADTDRLVQVFGNFLQNSVDHGGAEVTVRVGPLGDGFYVEDDGPGIPADDRERVFDHGYTPRPDGTGYGLSVVRSVVGAHGLDIAVTDADPGPGSRSPASSSSARPGRIRVTPTGTHERRWTDYVPKILK